MKKLLFTLAFAMCVSSAAFAQFSNGRFSSSRHSTVENPWSLGIRAGMNLSSLGGTLGSVYDSKIGFNVGLNVEYSIIKQVAIKSGIYFTIKGAKYSDSYEVYNYYSGYQTVEKDYTINEDYLQIPILGSYKLPLNNKLNLEFNFGPYLAYGIAGKTEGDNTFGSNGLDTFDFGLIGGTGLTYKKFYVGLQYDLGLSNIAPSASNRNFSVNVGYNF
jgi:hypothetical protein